MRVALLIPAAGSGSRLGCREPKALVDVVGVSLLRRTADRLAGAFAFCETVVLAPASTLAEVEAAMAGAPAALGPCRVVTGGASRGESVRLGLAALAGDADLVCVHDAARPLVPAATLRRVLEAAAKGGAATAASRPVDSVRIDDGDGSRALDRARLWLVETPQAFGRALLERAHRRAEAAGIQGTDDASLVEALGQRIEIVESDGPNFKVTVAADLLALRELFRSEKGPEHR